MGAADLEEGLALRQPILVQQHGLLALKTPGATGMDRVFRPGLIAPVVVPRAVSHGD